MTCRVSEFMWCRGKDACRGADWITRSFANASAGGAAIDRPGGGPFLRDVVGVFIARANGGSGSGGLLIGLPPFCRFSINLRCCSRMFIALSICSRIVGSCVLKPGERHATPISCSCSPALSRAVRGADGRADSAPAGAPFDMFELARLRRLGRWRAVGRAGDVGSFFTITLGMGPVLERLKSALCTISSQRTYPEANRI